MAEEKKESQRRPSGGDVVRASYGRGKIAVVNKTKEERKR